MLGIVSTIFLVAVIIIDGFTKPDAPGSLRSPAETNFGLQGMERLGMAFGLFMAGVSLIGESIQFVYFLMRYASSSVVMLSSHR